MDLQNLQTAYENLDVYSSQVVEGFITGMHKSPFHGFSVEFAEHRIYNTGESTKHIDWKLFGRTDKLFVKRFEEETNLRCHLLLDVSESMYYPASTALKFKYAAVVAAVLANVLKRQRDAFSLTCFADQIVWQSELKSSASHYQSILHELSRRMQTHEPLSGSRIADALNQMAERIHRRSLVVIISDMFESDKQSDALFKALQHLRFKKHEVLIFNINDAQTENRFEFDNRPYQFIDAETKASVKLFPDQVKALYLEQIQAYRKGIYDKCHQYKIDFNDIDIQAPLQQILLPFFKKRQSMH